MDLGEIGWRGVECIHLAQDRDWWQALMNEVMNLWILAPQSSSISYAKASWLKYSKVKPLDKEGKKNLILTNTHQFHNCHYFPKYLRKLSTKG
jgi:hypothetical protein